MTDPIRLRTKTEADRPFLTALYASTRTQEMAIVPWSDEQKQAFLLSQFDAQTSHYDQYYDGADFLIIESTVHLRRSRSSTSPFSPSSEAPVSAHAFCATYCRKRKKAGRA